MKPLSVKDLAPEVKEKIIETLHATKEWRSLQNKIDRAKLKYDIITVKKTMDLMRQVETNALQSYVDSIVEEKITIAEFMKGMNEEDRDYLMDKLYGIVFMCDVLDSYIINADYFVKTHFPDSEITFYNTLKALGKEVKLHINQILGRSTQENDMFFCNYSDRIISYAEKQIKVYYRKQKRLKAKEERLKRRYDKEVQKAHQ